MISKCIITREDIEQYQAIGQVPDGRIEPYITKSQELDLKSVLNEVLYYDFMSKFDILADPMYDAYQNLLNGVAYVYSGQTVDFPGIKPMLCAFTLARFLPMNAVNITKFGVTKKLNGDRSEPVDQSQITYLVNGLKADGMAYQEQLVRFLENNTSTYTLYNTSRQESVNQGSIKVYNSAQARKGNYGGWWNGNYYP